MDRSELLTRRYIFQIMEDIIPLPVIQLYLKNTEGKGRGVFCLEDIPKGTLIHISPVLVLKGDDTELSQQTILQHYTYNWGIHQAVALGLGSMFNHNRSNNVGFIKKKEKDMIEYHTLENVPAGTELCINYGPNLWFDDADGPADKTDVRVVEEEQFDLLSLEI